MRRFKGVPLCLLFVLFSLLMTRAVAAEEAAKVTLDWEKPVRVRRAKSTALSIPAGLATRAAFLARLHRHSSVDAWLTHVIQERVEIEEAAFAGAKHHLSGTH